MLPSSRLDPAPRDVPLDVAGVVYVVGRSRVRAALVRDGAWSWAELADLGDVIEAGDALRDELVDTMAVARRRLPRLREFAEGWGRALIPADVLTDPPDVVVLVPHAVLHRLPLHLVAADDGRALACRSGTAYSSSLTAYCRGAARNPARGSLARRRAAGGGTDVVDVADAEFRELAAAVLGQFEGSETSRQLDSAAPVGPPARRPFDRWALRRALTDGSADVLCVVAHGIVDPDQHRESGLLLDEGPSYHFSLRIHGESVQFADVPVRDVPEGWRTPHGAAMMTLAELEMAAPARAELAFLLACWAGASELLRGDEPARAWPSRSCDSAALRSSRPCGPATTSSPPTGPGPFSGLGRMTQNRRRARRAPRSARSATGRTRPR